MKIRFPPSSHPTLIPLLCIAAIFCTRTDGLGYYDDGEERLGDEENIQGNKKRRSGTADLTAAALKRARKAKSAMQAMAGNKHNSSNNNNNDADDEVVANNRSMWDFVQRGGGIGSSRSSNVGTTTNGSRCAPPPMRSRNVDDLLGELDDVATELTRTSRGFSSSSSSRRRVGPTSSLSGTRRSSSSSARPRLSSSAAAFSQQRHSSKVGPSRVDSPENQVHHHQQQDEYDDDFGAGGFDDGNDDDHLDCQIEKKNNMTVDPSTPETPIGPTEKGKGVNDENESKPVESESSENEIQLVESNAANDDEGNTALPKRRLTSKKLLSRRSGPAQKAVEEQKVVPDQKTSKDGSNCAPTGGWKAPVVDTTSPSFSPEEIAAESSPTTAPNSATLDSFVVREEGEDGDSTYIDMFWMDASERNGHIHLFGKVAVPDQENRFVSCCAVIKGNLRNLFVLPRKTENGEYAGWEQVHGEMKGILQPRCIPKEAGASWAGKVVEREYAFDDPNVPRQKNSYLKVVYDAKYPPPGDDVCNHGGEFVDKILNAKASTLETFILKRKLMGPCWLRISNPSPSDRQVSWCSFELQVDSPKQVQRLDQVLPMGTSPRPAPPVVTVSLKLKTIVNPKTQTNEIVSVSAVCHKQVLLDTSTDQSPSFMTQVSLIRPIHLDNVSSNMQGMAKFPRDIDKEIEANMPQLKKMVNERALLSFLLTQIGNWDPDVIVGHHAWGHDISVLLTRCIEHKIRFWSKLGRRRNTDMPSKSHFASGKDWAIADAITGRLLCDTYLSAQEYLHETTYSLTNLAETQLKSTRRDIEPMDTPQYFESSQNIVALARHTLNDAQLVQRLMFKLQILPLTKQLTNIAGNLWSMTMKSNRASRTEYLLLHEFHRLKFIVPEKQKAKREDGTKAKYAGGLVLEPKKGLYDTFILLLDFNSLYPSLIQEYNLCFTTVTDWATFHHEQIAAVANKNDDDNYATGTSEELPPLPDESQDTGVLPKVIRSLVQRRRQVKALMKKESNSEKYEEVCDSPGKMCFAVVLSVCWRTLTNIVLWLSTIPQKLDIKQKAFKLTANSMYGCLGFSHSRFYAQPIAALVTSMGRQTLQRTVDIAQSTVGLEVIYGDTDSIMINTRISDPTALSNVWKLGEQVKKEVNKLYKTLELEIDGVFRAMLLLKKKKYAAITVEQRRNGEIVYAREEKGLDLVRRDWCVQSKDTGHYVLDQILSTEQEKEVTISKILNHLEELAQSMRDGQLPLEKYVITKGLSKHPKDYPDGKALPHVHVAKMMIQNNRRLTVGDHIPYVITAPLDTDSGLPDSKASSLSATERARHPDEISRSGGILKPDVEWYLTQQILPPVSRLCEPIEGLSQGLIAQRLGLDSAKYTQRRSFGDDDLNDDELVNYVPESFKSDKERFDGVKKLHLTCLACGACNEFPGVLYDRKDNGSDTATLASGFVCVNPNCHNPQYWGSVTPFECMARIMNSIAIVVREQLSTYYQGYVKCDDPACGLETRQLSVNGGVCLNRGCNGRMSSMVSERTIQTQLKYFECLFDTVHVCKQLADTGRHGGSTQNDLEKFISKADRRMANELCKIAKSNVEECAYNWISPSFWQSMFGGICAKQ